MAQDDKRGEADVQVEESTQMKKRARRRLIGAAALALLAAILLPMVMDHQPAPALKDIQVRIPSPDEGVAQRVPGKPRTEIAAAPAPDNKTTAQGSAPVTTEPAPPVTAPTPATRTPSPPTEPAATPESWEIQLGAYQNPASVTNLVRKLKDLGVPTYTENVETPNGPRTRVRAGPFPTQEAAEKARARVKIVGVDGPVARKP